MKQQVTLALSLTLAAGLLAGCADTTGGSQPTGAAQTSPADATPSAAQSAAFTDEMKIPHAVAAQYLSLGGSLDHVPALALVGFLMEPQDHDSMLRAVKHMNDGGDAENAYYAAQGKAFKGHSPQHQQTM